jgi:glutaminyl-tRNA synthetase
MRRRGYTPAAIRNFAAAIGVAKNDNLVDMGLLESCVRDDLNETAPRAMAVLRPLKVILDNWPEGETEEFDCANHPQKPELGSRKVPFSRVLYIEREDFEENPPKKYKRLAPGKEVRLRNAYVIRFERLVKDEKTGEIAELHCTIDPSTRSGPPTDVRKVDGVIHWVSAEHAVPAEVRLYDRLFTVADPAGEDYLDYLNPDSLKVLEGCLVEPSLGNAGSGGRWQFERIGYFCADAKDTAAGRPVFNRIVPLRDTWSKIAGQK